MKTKQRFVVSLGGSLIVPDEIDVGFLANFKKIIETEVRLGNSFLLITGGGRTSRRYSDAAKKLQALHSDDLDWLGIHSTRLNGHLLRTIFRKLAHPRIIKNPHHKEPAKEPVIIAAGYKPGWSTDYVAVLLARKYGANVVLNLSNIDYVYNKDPRKFKDAKAYTLLSWPEFRKIVGSKWDPGLNAPFDPVASKLAQKHKLTVIIMNGKNLINLKRFFAGKSFKGTVIA